MRRVPLARWPSRPQRRALEREDEAILDRPLTRREDERALAAHVRRMVKHLRDDAATSPSAAMVTHIGAVFDRSAERREVGEWVERVALRPAEPVTQLGPDRVISHFDQLMTSMLKFAAQASQQLTAEVLTEHRI